MEDDCSGGARPGATYCERERARGSARFAALAEAGLAPKDLDGAFEHGLPLPRGRVPAGRARACRPSARAPARPRALLARAPSRSCPTPIPAGSHLHASRSAPASCARRLRVADSRAAGRAGGRSSPAGHRRASADPRSGGARRPSDGGLTRVEALVGRVLPGDGGAVRRRLAAVLLPAGRRLPGDARPRGRRGARRRAVALNYEDLLQIAARLLRERADVRAALQAKYRWLFVDEFQDTDPIQAEVICLLARRAGPAAPARLDARRRSGPAPSSSSATRSSRSTASAAPTSRPTTACGRASRRRAARIVAADDLVPIACPVLCEWANTVFPRFFPRRATPQQPAFDRLDPVREPGDLAAHGRAPARRPRRRSERAEVAGARRRRDRPVHPRRGRRRAAALGRLPRPDHAQGGARPVRERPRRARDPGRGERRRRLRGVRRRSGCSPRLLGALSDPGRRPGARRRAPRPALRAERRASSSATSGAGWPLRRDRRRCPRTRAGPVADALRRSARCTAGRAACPAPAAVERILEATGWLAAGAAAGEPGRRRGRAPAPRRRPRAADRGGRRHPRRRREALEEDLESARSSPCRSSPAAATSSA